MQGLLTVCGDKDQGGAALANDDLDKIERLHALRERGLLSEDEFAQEKRKLLSGQSEGRKQPQGDVEANTSVDPEDYGAEDASSRRRVVWLIVAALVIGAAIVAFVMLWSNPDSDPRTPQIDASEVAASESVPTPTPPTALDPVSKSDFGGQDEIPHCTLTNASGLPIFLSAIMMDGSRGAIIRREGKLIPLTLAGAPNRFSGQNGSLSVAVNYDARSVSDVGEDGVRFPGQLVVSANGQTQSQPVNANCYAAHFDQSWMGASPEPVVPNATLSGDTSIEPSIIGVPAMAFSKNFPNGTLATHRGTWAKDQQSCSNAPASELITISQNRISAFNENGEIIQGAKYDGYVEYTTKFNLDGQTWYRDFLLRGQYSDSFTLSSIAFDNAMATGRRVPMADTTYVRCS